MSHHLPPRFEHRAFAVSGVCLGAPDHVPLDRVAGIDEAGRGCLAGPVVAAAVILPSGAHIEGLNDSKVVPVTRRAGMAAEIGAQALGWGLGVVWPHEIDQLNILEATFKAMSRAVRILARTRAPELLLVDGDKTIPPHWLLRETGQAIAQKAIVDGDALAPVISAASVLAKVFRDDLMERLDRRYPGYGFARHKGYGTPEHLAALRELGPSPLHRLSFRKVRPEEPDSPQRQQGLLL
ncbi:MAG TPA: ribonuclease HII [Candidatus Avidesulfovibrio excrementigallinarum]|nr:ribonuclease HII [Candidatus Avidesulfovibrio excrementigallinarum]